MTWWCVPLVLSSHSLLLLLVVHFSNAQYSEAVQPVCLIAFHFQRSLPAGTHGGIHTSDVWGESHKVLLW